MQIKWFEIIAQMINFFILLFILQKLFYKPVMKSMQDRQQRISDIQSEAEGKMNEADHLIETYQQKLAEWEEAKGTKMIAASREAQEKKDQLIQIYQEEAAQKRNDYFNEVTEEQERFLREVRMVLGKSAVTIAGEILSAISKEDLEQKIFDSFMEKIHRLDQKMLQEEIKSTADKIVLSSAKPLSESQQDQLEAVLREKLDSLGKIIYEVDENLIQGFELNLRSLTVNTNIKHYLKESEENIQKILEQKKN
ncbi:F0F1 ATP synthase subunit delta [Acetobacterium carbinolicum]|uniref:F0F1 ATP synthase subunit delta n=1 Tax=Acetobacterium carbinolicum TaxID=52690 RepID=UPI0039C9A0E3